LRLKDSELFEYCFCLASTIRIMRFRPDPRYVEPVLRGMLVLLLVVSAGLLVRVILLRGNMDPAYNTVSNAMQLVASLATAGAATWAYYRRIPDLFLAHGAFAGVTWTLANTFWYAYFILIGEGLNYPTVADLGFAGVFLFLISGYQEGMTRNSLPGWYMVPIMVLFPLGGLGLTLMSGLNPKTLTTFVVFVLAAVLLSEALLRSAWRYPRLFAATLIFVLAHLFNSLDSTLPGLPWFVGVETVGALAAIAFSLFALGFLDYSKKGGT
jgi:hypothetical protein